MIFNIFMEDVRKTLSHIFISTEENLNERDIDT